MTLGEELVDGDALDPERGSERPSPMLAAKAAPPSPTLSLARVRRGPTPLAVSYRA
jgi:hypothetical protein